MPIYTVGQGVGRGLSTAGLNKDQGWGSRTAGGQIIAGHEGEQGLNRVGGLSRALSLDTANNPLVSARQVTGITATAATVQWTTAAGQPLASLAYKVSGTQGAVTTVNETGTPPVTAHSIALA